MTPPENLTFTKEEEEDRCSREHDKPMYGCAPCFLFLVYTYVSSCMTGGAPILEDVARMRRRHRRPEGVTASTTNPKPEPRRGDVWQHKADKTYVLVTTAWAGVVLTRTMTDCPTGICEDCVNTTHMGIHLGEVEEAAKLEEFLKAYSFAGAHLSQLTPRTRGASS